MCVKMLWSGFRLMWCLVTLGVFCRWKNVLILCNDTGIDRDEPAYASSRHRHPSSIHTQTHSYTHSLIQMAHVLLEQTNWYRYDHRLHHQPTVFLTVHFVHTGELIWGLTYRMLFNELNIIFVANEMWKRKWFIFIYMVRKPTVKRFILCDTSVLLSNLWIYGFMESVDETIATSWRLWRDESIIVWVLKAV